MRRAAQRLATLMVFCLTGVALGAPPLEKVAFLADSISKKNGNTIGLLGGSVWTLSQPTLALETDDIIIVFRELEAANKKKVKVALAFVDGEKVMAEHVGGQFLTVPGTLTSVVDERGDGTVLELRDGRVFSVPEYDRFDTGWWLPPYPALVTSDEQYLWNLKKVKRVWVTPKKPNGN